MPFGADASTSHRSPIEKQSKKIESDIRPPWCLEPPSHSSSIPSTAQYVCIFQYILSMVALIHALQRSIPSDEPKQIKNYPIIVGLLLSSPDTAKRTCGISVQISLQIVQCFVQEPPSHFPLNQPYLLEFQPHTITPWTGNPWPH